jgi:hypothetical protein
MASCRQCSAGNPDQFAIEMHPQGISSRECDIPSSFEIIAYEPVLYDDAVGVVPVPLPDPALLA